MEPQATKKQVVSEQALLLNELALAFSCARTLFFFLPLCPGKELEEVSMCFAFWALYFFWHTLERMLKADNTLATKQSAAHLLMTNSDLKMCFSVRICFTLASCGSWWVIMLFLSVESTLFSSTHCLLLSMIYFDMKVLFYLSALHHVTQPSSSFYLNHSSKMEKYKQHL